MILCIAGIIKLSLRLKSDMCQKKNNFSGKEYMAEVTRITSTGSEKPNPMHRYHIEYKWTDEEENEKEGQSDYIYTYVEALAMKEEKYIKIKAGSGKSIILSKPNPKLLTGHTAEYKEIFECKYCGNVFEKSERKCPSCGADIKKQKQYKKPTIE